MRIKLPENFGGLSLDGEPVELEPDEDGCVDAGEGVAQALLSHGGTIAPDVVEENARIDQEVEAHDQRLSVLTSKRQKGRGARAAAPAEEADETDKDEG